MGYRHQISLPDSFRRCYHRFGRGSAVVDVIGRGGLVIPRIRELVIIVWLGHDWRIAIY